MGPVHTLGLLLAAKKVIPHMKAQPRSAWSFEVEARPFANGRPLRPAHDDVSFVWPWFAIQRHFVKSGRTPRILPTRPLVRVC